MEPPPTLDPQRWVWRLRPAASYTTTTTASSSSSPSPSSPSSPATPPPQLYVRATPSSPTVLSLTATLSCPLPSHQCVRLRLIQEVALRRDTSRRRSRALPAPFAAPLRLNTGVGRGGIVADRVLLDTTASRVAPAQYALQCDMPCQRSWTWAAAEGDRKKIWFLDLRYRVVADVIEHSVVIATARTFCCLKGRTREPVPHRVREGGTERRLRWPSSTSTATSSPAHPTRHRSALDTSCVPEGVNATGNSNRRAGMVFDRPRRDDVNLSSRLAAADGPTGPSGWARQLSSLSGRGKASATTAVRSGTGSVVWGDARADPGRRRATREFEDVVLSVAVADDGDVTLGGEVTAAVRGRMKGAAWTNVRVAVVLTETVELVDDFGNAQVVLAHHHRMQAARVESGTAGRGGHEFACEARLPIPASVFSEDECFGDFVRVSHHVDVSVKYERRRGLALRGSAHPAVQDAGNADAGDLWEVGASAAASNSHEREVAHSVPVGLRSDKCSREMTAGETIPIPSLAVWGSTGRVPAVGTSECRRSRSPPAWLCEDGQVCEAGGCFGEADAVDEDEEDSRGCFLGGDGDEPVDGEFAGAGSAIDLLRRLAYAKGRSASNSAPGPGGGAAQGTGAEALLRRFPSFVVDGGGLVERTCPVCLEGLRGATVMMLPCLHAGHRACLARADCTKPVCPVCRLDLSPFLAEGVVVA